MPNEFDDSINLLSFLEKRAKDAVTELRRQLGNSDWLLISAAVRDSLVKGLAPLGGLLAADGSTSRHRYRDWIANHVPLILRTCNQSLSLLMALGGPLPAHAHIVDQFATILDRLFTDLVLLAFKLPRPCNATFPRESFEGVRLATVLADAKRQIDVEVEMRFENLLRAHVDRCNFFLVWSVLGQVSEWAVVVRPDRRTVFRETNAASDQFDVHQVSFDFDDDVFPVGKLTSVHFALARSIESLSAVICEELGVSLDRFDSNAFDNRMQQSFGDRVRMDASFAVMSAHPEVVSHRAVDVFRSISGLITLYRSATQEDWIREFAHVTSLGSDIRAFRGDPSALNGFAVELPRNVDGAEALPRYENPSLASSVSVVVPNACLPLDDREMQALMKRFDSHPAMSAVIKSLVLQIGDLPPTLNRIRKAFRFWTKAELQREKLENICLSPWEQAELFLDYCTVAEILLGANSNVVEVLSTRAAAIVAAEPEDRIETAARVKSLYDKRSRYVHEGEALIRYQDLLDVRDITRHCLQYALQWAAVQLLDSAAYLNSTVLHDESDANEATTEDFAQILSDKAFGREEFSRHCDLLRFGGPRAQLFRDLDAGSGDG
jgi:hypothetical protein